MKAIPVAVAVFWFLLACGPAAFSQSALAARELAAATMAAQQFYNHAFANHSQLFNGPEYVDYPKRYHARTGHQFFLVPEMKAGSAYYNGHLLANVPLAYDLVFDQVVISPPESPLMLRLINENVRSFTFDGHHFIRLVADSTFSKDMRTGYYEVLLDRTVQVLAKHTKQMQEHINQQLIDVEFTATDKVFLKKDGRYYAITSKSSAMRPFADRAKEMQQYLRAHKLKFGRAQREASTLLLAEYYSSLLPR